MTSHRFIEHEHGIWVAVTPHATARVRESDAIDPTDRLAWYWRVDAIDGYPYGYDAGYAIDRETAERDAGDALAACEASVR